MSKQECTDKIKQIFDQCSKVGTAIKNDALSKCMEGKDSKFKAADLKKLLDESAPDDTATSSDQTDCSPQIGPVGWIVCPVTTLLAKMNDGMFS
ncbi:MAG TPA: hypothetical protein PK486_08545, partial [Trichococcus flocculiformis]|nr:hypothetical protein [Trichococcus flocculiformis]